MYIINKLTANSTIDFAAEELKRYLRMMMPRAGEIAIAYAPGARDGFRLGLMADFGLPTDEAADPALDDILHIDCDAEGGVIAGDNPRATLLAVYQYLRQNGCRWLFPGVDGELIPIGPISPVKYHKMADSRFRGECNEGAEAQENMLEAIDFAPKIGLNTFMLEFDIPYYYYDLWYGHKHNRFIEPEPVDNDAVLQWKRACEAEIAKRGLLFHDMGHGWTAEPFGVDSSDGWAGHAKEEKPVPESARKYLAEIGGKRGFFGNVPLNTNICMSNPEARATVARAVADYAQQQNNVDFLHVWLADGSNNHCECAECAKKRPTDWYVMMLNDIDAELTRRALATRIVFIVYVDSYWPPLEERLANPARFTMLFAPITRTYMESYAVEADMNAITPCVINKLTFPRGEAANMAYYVKWRELFAGDAFCYEYHFHKHHYRDPGYMHIARLLYDDIRALPKLNLGGIVEDQSQRNFLPNGFPMYLYGAALFDGELSFEAIRDDYFVHAYGVDWREALAYLEGVSARFPFDYLGGCHPARDKQRPYYAPELAEGFAEAKAAAEAFSPVARAKAAGKKRAQAVSWRLLAEHAILVGLLSEACRLKALGEDGAAHAAWVAFIDAAAEREQGLQRYLDVGLIGNCLGGVFRTQAKD